MDMDTDMDGVVTSSRLAFAAAADINRGTGRAVAAESSTVEASNELSGPKASPAGYTLFCDDD